MPALAHFILVEGDHERSPFADQSVAEHDYLAHRHSQGCSVFTPGAASEFSHHRVALLDHANDLELGAPDEPWPLNRGVVGFLSLQPERSEHCPHDVVGETRQDLLVVGPPESLQLALDGMLVLR